MAITKKGEAQNYVWGIPSGIITTTGRIRTISSARSVEKEPLQDEQGETDGLVYLDKQTGGTIEALIPTGFHDIELASSVTFDGKVCHIEKVTKNWEYRGWAKYTIEVSGYDLITA